MTDEAAETPSFDFDQHGRAATEGYREVRETYERLANAVRHILLEGTDTSQIPLHSIQARAKDLDSLAKKAAQPSETDPNKPEYPDPLKDITDLAGVRVITFSPRTLWSVDECINKEFLVLDKSDKGEQLAQEGRFGYLSIHYLVKMKPERVSLTEYSRFQDLTAEIQLRTILQHAWAELEHDIQYKSVAVIPRSIRRRFMALAGMLEIADREFEAIQVEDERLREQARTSVASGQLESVEVTPDALRSFLDKRLGPDARIRLATYDYTARVLRRMGFSTLQQIDGCIQGFDADQISRLRWGQIQGQISKFEDTLMAAMGENYAQLHPWRRLGFWQDDTIRFFERLRSSGIEPGDYSPVSESDRDDEDA